MSLVMLLVTIAVMGLLVWALTSIPMPEPFRRAIIVIAVVILVFYVLQTFGLMPNLGIRIVK